MRSLAERRLFESHRSISGAAVLEPVVAVSTRLADISCPADLRGLSHRELTCLCAEIREVIVATVAQTGGHLGSNLGIVEVTVALHRVLDSPSDRIVWDTGHQTYPHKLITGRAP